MIRPPTSAIPGPKELTSPINPIRVGEAPPPSKKAMGTVRETIRFLSLGELTMDNAARPAGKKQTATSGCRKTATLIQDDEAKPINIVINPVNKNTTLKICFGPIRSVAHPPVSLPGRQFSTALSEYWPSDVPCRDPLPEKAVTWYKPQAYCLFLN